ncbi:MAG: hypothetical protein AAF184_17935 [Pseudomonadota bacterium]
MSNLKALICAASLALAESDALADPPCQGDWLNDAAPLNGHVSGSETFLQTVTDDLSFSLVPDASGWQVQMLGPDDRKIPTRPVASGIAPRRGESAPSRAFAFGPDVMDPALNPELQVPQAPQGESSNVATVEPTPGLQGRGWLIIEDSRFADEAPHRRDALEFRGCVHWNLGPREPDTSHYPHPQDDLVNFPSWVVLAFEECGLSRDWLLSGRMPREGYRQRAWLEPDLDGDARPDLAALVDEVNGTDHGLALCLRESKRLMIMTPDNSPTSGLDAFLREAEWWNVDGRTIVIAGGDAQSIRVHLDEDGAPIGIVR